MQLIWGVTADWLRGLAASTDQQAGGPFEELMHKDGGRDGARTEHSFFLHKYPTKVR